MAADNKLELVIQIDAAGANASIKSVNTSLSGLEKTAVSSAKGASQGIDGMTASMAKAVVVGNAIYDVAKEAFKAIKEFTLGAIETADVLGKTAEKVGLTVEQVSALRYIAKIADVPLDTLNRTVGILYGRAMNPQCRALLWMNSNVWCRLTCFGMQATATLMSNLSLSGKMKCSAFSILSARQGSWMSGSSLRMKRRSYEWPTLLLRRHSS